MEGFTRRDLLATPFRVGNKPTLGNDTESAEPRFVGTVRTVGNDSLTLSVDGRVHSVSLATSAEVSRGNHGPLSDLGSFQPGDRIVVEGHKIDNGHTVASVVATPFSGVKTTILGFLAWVAIRRPSVDIAALALSQRVRALRTCNIAFMVVCAVGLVNFSA